MVQPAPHTRFLTVPLRVGSVIPADAGIQTKLHTGPWPSPDARIRGHAKVLPPMRIVLKLIRLPSALIAPPAASQTFTPKK